MPSDFTFRARVMGMREQRTDNGADVGEADVLVALFDVPDSGVAVGNRSRQIIDRGAFRSWIDGTDFSSHPVPMFVDHGDSHITKAAPTVTKKVGYADGFRETDEGLVYKAHYNLGKQIGRDAWADLKFDPKGTRYSFRWKPDEDVYLDEKGTEHVRSFSEVMEVSQVGLGAQAGASVLVGSMRTGTSNTSDSRSYTMPELYAEPLPEGGMRLPADEGFLGRALSEGSGSGSYLVPEEFLPRVWDRLAAASVGLRSGFTVIPTVRDTLHIPLNTGDISAAWTDEGAAITPSDPGFNEVVAIPRKLAALTVISNELRDDSNPAVVQVVEGILIRSLALKLDLGFYEGTGTPPEIRGMKNVSGIQTVSMGANGSALTNLDVFADAIGLLEQENAEARAIVMPPRTWKQVIKLKETSTSNKPLVTEGSGTPTSGISRTLYGVPVYLTSQLTVTETQGTSNNSSSVYVYQGDQAIAVRRQEIRVEIDPYRLFNTDQTELRAISRFDFVVPNPKAVVRILGIIP